MRAVQLVAEIMQRPMLLVGRGPMDEVLFIIHDVDEADFARLICRILQHWAKGRELTDEEAWRLVREEWKNPTHRGGITFELDKGE